MSDRALQTTFVIQTSGSRLYEFTREVSDWVAKSRKPAACLTLFVQHTSCSLLIQEDADPDVRSDLLAFMQKLVPPSDHPSMAYLEHTLEGPDDMPAHIKAALMPVSLSIPVADGRITLGTWQGIYLFEHRDRPHTRYVAANLA